MKFTSFLTLILSVIFIGLAPMALAKETLHPKLSKFATPYWKTADELFSKQQDALKAAAEPYLKALAEAEQDAADGDEKALVLDLKHQALIVGNNVLQPKPPAFLPKKARRAHKKFIKEAARADRDFNSKVRSVQKNYIVQLKKLSRKAKNEELANQIAHQKTLIQSGSFGPIKNLATDLVGTVWESVDDPNKRMTFDSTTRFNEKWRYEISEKNELTIFWNPTTSETYTIGKDGRTLWRLGGPKKLLVSKN